MTDGATTEGAAKLIKRFAELNIVDLVLDWNDLRKEIGAELHKTKDAAQRSILLGMHKDLMDLVEKSNQIIKHPEKRAAFQRTRRQEYIYYLIEEALIGEHISPELMFGVCQREIAAGRMREDDEYFNKVKETLKLPGTSIAALTAEAERKEASRKSLIGRLKGWWAR